VIRKEGNMKLIYKVLILFLIISTVSYAGAGYSYEDLSKTYTLAISPYDTMYLTLNPVFSTANDFTKVVAVEAIIEIHLKNDVYPKYKVIIEKAETEYIYNLVEDVTRLPLQLGSGDYTVTLLGSSDGRRYRTLNKTAFAIELEEDVVFLSSSQTVFFESEDEVNVLAKALTKDAESNEEKLEILHTYLIEHVRYDYEKAKALPKGYIPSPLETLEVGGGICYDFSALLGAMLRSVDVPTKLIKGYSSYTPVYHAWNEVLIDDEWWVIDSSTDSIFYDYKVTYKLRKSEKDYETSKFY